MGRENRRGEIDRPVVVTHGQAGKQCFIPAGMPAGCDEPGGAVVWIDGRLVVLDVFEGDRTIKGYPAFSIGSSLSRLIITSRICAAASEMTVPGPKTPVTPRL